MKPFKVVCIMDHLFRCSPKPIKGEIYKVISLNNSGWYHLDGFNFNGVFITTQRIAFNPRMFRPVQDIGDQVQEHINKLIKEEDLKTISV